MNSRIALRGPVVARSLVGSKLHSTPVSARLMRRYLGLPLMFCALYLIAGTSLAVAESLRTDLLTEGENAWRNFGDSGWHFEDGSLVDETSVLDGAITDPGASIFLVSKDEFGGDTLVQMDITFEVGRYIGVYLNFSQESQTGIWMATGHAISEEEQDHHVETGYIKTVESGHWVVRATGEMFIGNDRRLSLQVRRKGDKYTLSRNGRLVAVYHKEGGYPAGPLQLRLVNAKARIDKLTVLSD